jgi:hypothetical protein
VAYLNNKSRHYNARAKKSLFYKSVVTLPKYFKVILGIIDINAFILPKFYKNKRRLFYVIILIVFKSVKLIKSFF